MPNNTCMPGARVKSLITSHIVLLAALANPDVKAKLETEAGYFAANHERMQYRDFQHTRQHTRLPIGSGSVESDAKQAKHRLAAAGMRLPGNLKTGIITDRLAAAGMRWSRDGLDNMLPLRAAVISGTFDLLWPEIWPR